MTLNEFNNLKPYDEFIYSHPNEPDILHIVTYVEKGVLDGFANTYTTVCADYDNIFLGKRNVMFTHFVAEFMFLVPKEKHYMVTDYDRSTEE